MCVHFEGSKSKRPTWKCKNKTVLERIPRVSILLHFYITRRTTSIHINTHIIHVSTGGTVRTIEKQFHYSYYYTSYRFFFSFFSSIFMTVAIFVHKNDLYVDNTVILHVNNAWRWYFIRNRSHHPLYDDGFIPPELLLLLLSLCRLCRNSRELRGEKKKISERRFKAKKKIPKPPPYYVCMYIDIYLYVAMAPRTNSRLYKSEKRSKTAESIYYSKYVK